MNTTLYVIITRTIKYWRAERKEHLSVIKKIKENGNAQKTQLVTANRSHLWTCWTLATLTFSRQYHSSNIFHPICDWKPTSYLWHWNFYEMWFAHVQCTNIHFKHVPFSKKKVIKRYFESFRESKRLIYNLMTSQNDLPTPFSLYHRLNVNITSGLEKEKNCKHEVQHSIFVFITCLNPVVERLTIYFYYCSKSKLRHFFY